MEIFLEFDPSQETDEHALQSFQALMALEGLTAADFEAAGVTVIVRPRTDQDAKKPTTTR